MAAAPRQARSSSLLNVSIYSQQQQLRGVCDSSTYGGAIASARAMWPDNSSALAIAMLKSCHAAGYPPTSALTSRYFSEHWWPSPTACPGGTSRTTRYGPHGEGGKTVCNPSSTLGGSRCLIVSVGLNDDTRAEQAIHSAFPHCTIHGFDGTLTPANRAKLPSPTVLRFFPSNLGSSTYTRYVGQVVSLLKIDCEGCELRLLAKWLDHVCTEQIAVEIHGCSRMRYAVGNAHQRQALVHALLLRLDRQYTHPLPPARVLTRGKCMPQIPLHATPRCISYWQLWLSSAVCDVLDRYTLFHREAS